MIRFLLPLALLAMPAQAMTLHARDGKTINALTAGADRVGSTLDMSRYTVGACSLVWTSLTGSIDATAKVQVSLDGTNWDDKASGAFTISGASGHQTLPFAALAEEFYRVTYAHTSVTGGTITASCNAKE